MKVLKSCIKEARMLINFEASLTEKAAFVQNAKRYTAGNLSEWLRYASRYYQPKAPIERTKPTRPRKEARMLVNFEATEAEKQMLNDRAAELDISVSDWIRHAGRYHVPSDEHLIAVE